MVEVWLNYRCRKCHNIISVHCKVNEYNYKTDAMFRGMLFSAKDGHKCPEGIADVEKVLCDCVSTSEGPLPDAFEVIDKIKNKEKDPKEENK